ncbi:HEAT repeat domain-containing protein [Polymorphospora sp. NPDC050346]|uniref:HEAT repeat domain-containing protein n=1 Tax=Polymorphospora sp. NPDC050346 TaxID=3155780 RepID=UPI0033D9AD61
MSDERAALQAVVRHAVDLDGDYDGIAPSITALKSCGDTALVPLLHEALDRFLDDGNFYGRDLIADILAGSQEMAALPVLLRASSRDLGDDQDSLSALIIDLMDEDRAAARITVLEFAASHVPELRRTGLWALGFVVESADADLLAAAVNDPDPRARSLAVGSLQDPSENNRTFDVLVGALHDRDEQVRVSAISRLGYTGRIDAVAPIAALASDTAHRVRAWVAYALGRLGHPDAAPVLLHLRQDSDSHVRSNAIEAFGSIGGPVAVDALLTLADDDDPQLRARAAEALPKAVDFDPRVERQLAVLLGDSEAAVRAATIRGLASAAGRYPQAVPLVVGLAGDPDPTVRQRVAVVVRRLAPDAAPDILRRYVDDPDQTVRWLADTELTRLTDPGATGQ